MKKLLALALCLLIAALVFQAVAEETPEFPFIEDPFEDRSDDDLDTHSIDQNQSIEMIIDGQSHTLGFDATPEYSSVKNGMVQASFYEYDEPTNTLYELYLIFPDTAESGSVVDPESSIQSGSESSVVMIVSDDDTEKYYVSGVMDGQAYPEGSSFSIGFDFVEPSGDGAEYAGTLSAALVALDLTSGEVLGTMDISSAAFRFSISGASPERHDDPLPTSAPSDMRRV